MRIPQQVFEVKIDSTTSDIQSVINQAGCERSPQTDGVISAGLYRPTATLTIPQDKNPLAGDGCGCARNGMVAHPAGHGQTSGSGAIDAARDLQFVASRRLCVTAGGSVAAHFRGWSAARFGLVSASALKNTRLNAESHPIPLKPLDQVESASAIAVGGDRTRYKCRHRIF
jgi:hypothetical protein